MVEMALVLPLMTLLVFGAIDMGLVLADSSAIGQGAREGARAATVHNYGTDTTCPITGASPSPEAAALICLTKDRIGLNPADIRIKLLVGAGGDAVGEPITICVQYPRESRSGVLEFMFSGEVVTRNVTMRLESDGTLVSVAETPLAAGGWAGCSP